MRKVCLDVFGLLGDDGKCDCEGIGSHTILPLTDWEELVFRHGLKARGWEFDIESCPEPIATVMRAAGIERALICPLEPHDEPDDDNQDHLEKVTGEQQPPMSDASNASNQTPPPDDAKAVEAGNAGSEVPLPILSDFASQDNEYLGYFLCAVGKVGYVDEVNGPGAKECPDYVPTQHELRELAKYWMREKLSAESSMFLDDQIGSDEMRISSFANRRLCRIEQIISEETINKVFGEVEEEMRKHWGDELWEIFKTGDKGARDRHVALWHGSERTNGRRISETQMSADSAPQYTPLK